MRGCKKYVIFLWSTLVMLVGSPVFAKLTCVTTLLGLTREEFRRSMTRSGPTLPLPEGMSATDFRNLMQILKYHAAFDSADVIVLYGSRLHLKAGYPARKDSDLDVAIFYESQLTNRLTDAELFEAITNRNDYATHALIRTSQTLGFSIVTQVPRVEDFETFLSEEKPFSFDQQLFALRLIDRLADDGAFNPSLYRDLYHRVRSKNWYNPEAIFIFRTQKNIESRIRALRAIGYRNFYFLF